MNPDRLIALITLLVDFGILYILVKEYNYDKIVYEKDQYKKRAKHKLNFDHLTTGEGR